MLNNFIFQTLINSTIRINVCKLSFKNLSIYNLFKKWSLPISNTSVTGKPIDKTYERKIFGCEIANSESMLKTVTWSVVLILLIIELSLQQDKKNTNAFSYSIYNQLCRSKSICQKIRSFNDRCIFKNVNKSINNKFLASNDASMENFLSFFKFVWL